MKKYIRFGSSIAILCFVMAIAGCNGDPEVTPTEEVTELLTSGTWKIQSVAVDGVDKSSSFTGLQLNFTSSSVTATNGGLIWPATTTWQFKDDAATSINRGDGVSVDISEITESRLVLKLTWSSTTFGPGRLSSIAGQHTFTFTK